MKPTTIAAIPTDFVRARTQRYAQSSQISELLFVVLSLRIKLCDNSNESYEVVCTSDTVFFFHFIHPSRLPTTVKPA